MPGQTQTAGWVPRSAKSSGLDWRSGRARGWNYGGRYGLRWVCTYSRRHPGQWIVMERLGTGNGRSAESTSVEGSVSSIVNMRLGIRYTVRLVVRRYENLPRSTNCEMQARNRSVSRICELGAAAGVGGWKTSILQSSVL